jgi:hypothetical protein
MEMNMQTFKEFINEAGEAAGKLELVKTKVEDAKEFAIKVFTKFGNVLEEEIPNFEENYKTAQKKAGNGRTLRKDMPVIDEKDVKDFQKRLEDGYIDINAKFSKGTDPKNPFPEGLSGKKAKEWLVAGLKSVEPDGTNTDKINTKLAKVKVSDLKPIQKQIYFDKSITATAEFGAKGTKGFLTKKSTFIVSADNFIIDGHHRFLSGLLIDPNLEVNCLVIDLPISKFLPLSLAYGDAVGNKRNA